MRAQDAPFRPYWWATSLDEAGVDSRSGDGTYNRYPFEDLPETPYPMDGDFAWLARQPAQEEWAIRQDVREPLAALTSVCEREGVPLPEPFARFMGSPDLQDRIRSTTACYLDLDAGTVPVPGGGRLIRFLADQQGCLFWYLFVTEDGADHAVVCTPEYLDSEEATEVEGGEAICFCAESFEAFLCRYWLENEIWFATEDGTPMPEVGPAYIERYRALAG
ncbi:hypothetical protein [Glycomyces paridis]|uniref:Uncharacterized protein n=1 Tax=Glycomyces paridis TaxID=2126555 RepID=A0A4S8P3B6_9ACTN|nr:hypothetical protein [Glycomyces paridis]THV24527.1 hypothetical protein E9998_21180 [Glycomyces paridis]